MIFEVSMAVLERRQKRAVQGDRPTSRIPFRRWSGRCATLVGIGLFS
jgi:hypothetical protein